MHPRYNEITKHGLLAAMLMSSFTTVTPTAFAQGPTQHVTVVNVVGVASGQRASKLIGSNVYNDGGQTIGTIDDLIIEPNNHNLFAVLSVGGFLGIGNQLVAIPYTQLKTSSSRIVFPSATKDTLKSLPPFHYTK